MNNNSLIKFKRIVSIAKFKLGIPPSVREDFAWSPSVAKDNLIYSTTFSEIQVTPWFTYSAIAFLQRVNISGYKVLEFGVGSSTIYFHENARECISFETDKAWIDYIQKSRLCKKDKGELFHTNDYVNSETLEKTINSSADIIVIDSLTQRQEISTKVSEQVLDGNLNPAIIILDNSDWYPESYKNLSALSNYIPIDFYGYGPINRYTWCTSFFVRRNIDLKLSPPYPLKSGIKDNHLSH